jgi:hypothetical protein
VVDWAGHAGQPTAYRYRSMAERQLRGISPTYERLCLGVASDPEMIARLDTLPAPKRQPNLLLGTVRFLSGPVGSYDAFRAFVLDRWDDLSATMLARRTQTNEARRCTAWLPVLAQLDGPLALLEVGASAGLCLLPDRYAYRYDKRAVVGTSDLVLSCTTAGPVPFPQALPVVVWRRGLDLNPLDIGDDVDVRWLRSLIWPEETERFEILDHAVAIARAAPPRITTGDLTTDLAAVAAEAPADATLVIYHSAVLAYLTDDQRDAFRRQVTDLAATRRTVWLSNEGPGVVVDTPVPEGAVPFVLARDGRPLATTSPHGEWLHWTDSARR